MFTSALVPVVATESCAMKKENRDSCAAIGSVQSATT
jgi:hypothetical protein